MTINFIPNDPHAAGSAVRQIKPAPDRPAGRAGFKVDALPPEQPYAPGTAEFTTWQARQAALSALDTFESIAGPLKGWQGDKAKLSLNILTDAGSQLNAFYNRSSLSFFHAAVAGMAQPLRTGGSTDTVAHECGHAILDALRPDLWNAQVMEVASFHEGFGDCTAMLTALSDQATRVAILNGDPTLAKANIVETLIEDLAFGIAQNYPGHNASVPRRGLNDFTWALPTTLPKSGPPGVMIQEIHSFGQLLAGTFYRTIQGVYRTGAPGEATLWTATKISAWLLARAVATAPMKPRFMQSVGRTMLAVEQAQYHGRYAPAIRAAYGHHGIDLTAGTPFAAAFGLDGGSEAKPLGNAGAATLRQVLGAAEGAKLASREVAVGDRTITQFSAVRDVDLSSVDPRLAGVVAPTEHVASVGRVNGMSAMLGTPDSPVVLDSEVRDYVALLVARDAIDFGSGAKPKARRKPGAGAVGIEGTTTHEVKGNVLTRARFACGCSRCGGV